jgi:hypothetical protein
MSLLLFALSLFSSSCSASLESSSPQLPSSCCEYLKQPNQLLDCVLHLNNRSDDDHLFFPSHQQLITDPKKINFHSQFIFLVFASQNINHYASLTLLINSQFITERNYQLIFLNEFNGGDYYPQDRRWNKIAAVIEALDPSHGWGLHSSQYLIAMDADLIILNPDFNLPDIISSSSSTPSHTNLILSADSSDIANTGFMIIRANQWSYQFFLTWFESRSSFDCDQHAFNDLYTQLMTTTTSRKTKKRIVILAPDAINTQFPVCATFDDKTNSILHLMGERDVIRKAIFEYAAESFCWDYLIKNDPFYVTEGEEEEGERDEDERAREEEEKRRRADRYGITQEVLSSITKEHLMIPLLEKYSLCSELLDDAPPHEYLQRRQDEQQITTIIHDINDCFSTLHSVTSDLCGAGKKIIKETRECNELYEKNYLLAQKGIKKVPFAQLMLADHMSRNLYDSFLLMDPSLEAIEAGEKVTPYLISHFGSDSFAGSLDPYADVKPHFSL